MVDGSPVEFDHCRELALLPGSVFEFTSRFLPAGKLEPLLALYALRQAIGSIPYGPADDSVKWAKLKWWSEEIVADPGESLRHPVLRALWLSGSRENLGNALLLQLVGDAISQIDAAPDADENAMFERQAETGATEIQLELALDDAEIAPQSLNFLGAATSSFRLISSFSGNQLSQTARLPLSMLAKFNVSATQLEQASHRVELTQIISQLAENTRDWFSKGISALNIEPDSSAGTHLQLRWAMENRRLNAILKDVNGFLETVQRFGPADAWFAWRFLRKLN
jgi:phytoene/squalene synthetase